MYKCIENQRGKELPGGIDVCVGDTLENRNGVREFNENSMCLQYSRRISSFKNHVIYLRPARLERFLGKLRPGLSSLKESEDDARQTG